MNLTPLENLNHVYWQTGVELWSHLKRRVHERLEAGNRRREEVRTPEALAAYGEEVRRFFLDSLGGLPDAPPGPPPVRKTGEIACPGYTIEKLILEPRPGVLMPGHLYLPTHREERTPAILFLCGHALSAKVAYQTLCQVLVQSGFIVLVVDPVGQGERCGYLEGDAPISGGTAEHEYCGVQCLVQGHNLMRYLLHDALRAMDYLSAHPAVDAAAIGVTGSSGGAMQTTLMMLVDPRVAAAAPASFVTSREAIFDSGFWQDAEQIWPGFTGAGYDHADLLAAFAPKPLAVLAAKYDYFPIEGTRETVLRARPFWEMHGCGERLELVEAASIHGYSPVLIQAAARFFARHLRGGAEVRPEEAVIEPLAGETLWCTRHGSVFREEPASRRVFEENREAFARSRADGNAAACFLREAVARHREPVAPNLRIVRTGELEGLRYAAGFWRGQRGIHHSGILLRPPGSGEERLPLMLAVWEGGATALQAHAGRVEEALSGGNALLVVNLSGVGPLTPVPINHAAPEARDGTLSRFNDDLITLGDSLAALRVHDVLQTVHTVPEWGGLEEGGTIRLCLGGRAGIYGALASVLEPRVTIATWDDPPPSYAELLTSRRYDDRDAKSYILPGLLTYADWSALVTLPAADQRR